MRWLTGMGWRTRLVIGLVAWPTFWVTAFASSAIRANAVSSILLTLSMLALLVGLVFPIWALISWARRGDRPRSAISAGWHDDPESPTRLRYHDGTAWTERTADKATSEPTA